MSFGEISFFSGNPPTSSVMSETFSTLFVLKKTDFLSVVKQNPSDYVQHLFKSGKILPYQRFNKFIQRL